MFRWLHGNSHIGWYKSHTNKQLYTCRPNLNFSSVPDRIYSQQFINFLNLFRGFCIMLMVCSIVHLGYAGCYCKIMSKFKADPGSILHEEIYTFFLGILALFAALFALHSSTLARRVFMIVSAILLGIVTAYLLWVVYVNCLKDSDWKGFMFPLSKLGCFDSESRLNKTESTTNDTSREMELLYDDEIEAMEEKKMRNHDTLEKREEESIFDEYNDQDVIKFMSKSQGTLNRRKRSITGYFINIPDKIHIFDCKKEYELFVGFFAILYCYFAGAALILAIAIILMKRTKKY